VLSRILGHTDTRIIKVYRHVAQEPMRDAMETATAAILAAANSKTKQKGGRRVKAK
jgi:hypothetical protein